MLEIHARWDDEARVWYATSDEVPGLCVEGDTFDGLIEAAAGLTPELLKLNRVEIAGPIILRLTAERMVTVKAA